MPDKPRRLAVAGQIGPEVNRYYAKVARNYTVAGVVALAVFLLFLCAVIVFGSDYITTENLGYLVREFGTVSDEGARDFGKIVYNGSDDTRFLWFRGGAAVCGTDYYRYFDKNGMSVIADPLNYAEPTLVSSEKYMLVYDTGGTGWAVYNQLTQIVSKTSDERIIAGDIADDGSLVLVTRSRDTKYVVELYNAAFNRSMLSYKDSYVLAAAISGDGKRFLTASAVPSSTDFDCEIEICERGEETPLTKDLLSHEMPLMASAAGSGFVVLCESAVHYYNEYGIHEKAVTLSGMTLKYADIRDGCVAVAGQANALGSEHRIVVLDANGETLCDTVLKQRVSGIRMGRNLSDALCCLWNADTVLRIGPEGERTEKKIENGDILDVLPLNAGALLCQKTAAWQIFADGQ